MPATVASDKEAYENDLDGYSLQSMYGLYTYDRRPKFPPENVHEIIARKAWNE